MLLCHMMSQEDEAQYRHQTLTFGGGGIRYLHSKEMDIGQLASIKIFLVDEAKFFSQKMSFKYNVCILFYNKFLFSI